MPEGCAIAQAVGLWPLKAEVRVWSQVSPCGICGGQYGTRASFSPSTPVSPCQYHFTDAPRSFLSTVSPYQKDKLAKPGNLKEQTSFVCREHWMGEYVHFFQARKCHVSPFPHSPPSVYLLAGGRTSLVQLAWFTSQLMLSQYALCGAAIWT